MSKVLIILGPFDRYNYGDLLFPFMIENELKNYYDSVRYVSSTESDLAKVGGKKTESFHQLYKLNPINSYTLIVAGGESLAIDWGLLCSYLFPEFHRFRFVLRLTRKIFGEMTHYRLHNFIGRKWLKAHTFLPFSVSKGSYENIGKVFYNSLGGSSLSFEMFNHFPQLKKIYQDVDYLSVRDQKTYSALHNNGIKPSLCPDSAILMSKFYPLAVLRKLVSPEVNSDSNLDDNYFFFQTSKYLGELHMTTIIEQLEQLYAMTNMKICLCPIGIALGHEDLHALRRISERLSVPHFSFPESITIWDIMYILASSKLYMGTSLHGAITAMSFKIPYIGLEVPKMAYYLETWSPSPFNTIVKFEDICKSASRALAADPEVLTKNLDEQVQIIEGSFLKMIDCENR